MEGFKYIKNIANNEGTMLLYNQIGSFIDSDGGFQKGIDGEQFAYEMKYLANTCDTINVRINSIGGSVLDGYSIFSAILNSSRPVYCYIDGLAASTAGWVALAGKKCYMADYGTFMLHNPEGGEDNKVLQVIKDSIVTILSNRTKKTPEEIDAMMNKETWISNSRKADYTLEQGVEMGLFDEIVNTGKKIKVKKSDSLVNLALVYNTIITPKNNMTKINTLLKISNDASESEQEAAIVALNKEVSDKDAELAELKNRLKVLEDEKEAKELAEKEALKNKATSLVVNAIKEGKLTEAEKEQTINNASKDEASFDFVANFISKIGNSKVATKIFDLKNFAGKEGAEDRSTWSFTDWTKKDEKGLAKMKNENPDLFMELYNKEFKK